MNRKGFRWQERELPFYEYRIDLYGYSRPTRMTLAIELKLHDWKRALQQTLIYQLCADLVYAALPRRNVAPRVLSSFREAGLGIIAVDDYRRCRVVLNPLRSCEVLEQYAHVPSRSITLAGMGT